MSIWIYQEYEGSGPERVACVDTVEAAIRWVETDVRHAHAEFPDSCSSLEGHIRVSD